MGKRKASAFLITWHLKFMWPRPSLGLPFPMSSPLLNLFRDKRRVILKKSELFLIKLNKSKLPNTSAFFLKRDRLFKYRREGKKKQPQNNTKAAQATTILHWPKELTSAEMQWLYRMLLLGSSRTQDASLPLCYSQHWNNGIGLQVNSKALTTVLLKSKHSPSQCITIKSNSWLKKDKPYKQIQHPLAQTLVMSTSPNQITLCTSHFQRKIKERKKIKAVFQ